MSGADQVVEQLNEIFTNTVKQKGYDVDKYRRIFGAVTISSKTHTSIHEALKLPDDMYDMALLSIAHLQLLEAAAKEAV